MAQGSPGVPPYHDAAVDLEDQGAPRIIPQALEPTSYVRYDAPRCGDSLAVRQPPMTPGDHLRCKRTIC
jgi:hypothetical protein